MLDLLHKVIFAFISGFSELIFASASAHQLLYRTVTGQAMDDIFLPLAIHAGCLVALLLNYIKRIKRLRYEQRLLRPGRRRRGRQADIASLMDVRILNTAVVPLILGFLLYQKAAHWISAPIFVALILTVNGVVLFLPRLLKSGNKDGRMFTQLDGLLMGIAGVMGIFPGFSRVGCMYCIGVARGADKEYALDLSYLLCIPAVLAMLCFDLYGCAVATVAVSGLQLLGALLAAIASYIGAHLAIIFVRFLCRRASTVGFAYYSWGFAVFLFLICLFIP